MRLVDLETLRPTSHQSEALVRVKIAPTEQVAYEYLQGDARLHTAADTLKDLGLIEYDPSLGTAELTDKGQEVMQQQALVDENGDLTEDGKKLISDEFTVDETGVIDNQS